MDAQAKSEALSALVVDDEATVRNAFSELLQELGYVVQCCDDLTSARTRLANSTPDVVLLDQALPDGTGLELAQELRQTDCAVIMMSGFANVSSAVEALQIGVADFLVKPFELDDVEARLIRVVEQLKLRRKNASLIADLEEKNQELNRLLATDRVTGVHNFVFYRQRLRDEIERGRRAGEPVSLIHFDIRGFSRVNEGYGHLIADEILARVAKALLGEVPGCAPRRAGDLVARVGADEFALILPSTPRIGAKTVAARTQTALAEVIQLPDGKPVLTAAGTATFPDDGSNSETLLGALDLAVRAAKTQANNPTSLVSYSDELAAAGQQQRAVAEKNARQRSALDESIKDREFRYVYQPVVSVSGDIFAYEALVRPQNSAFAHPGELFDTAERAGKVLDLGRVLRKLIVEPMDSLAENRRLFINLHPLDVYDADLLSGAETHLTKWAHRIVLEVTEVAQIRDFDRARTNLDVLRAQGFCIAVDDLGTGYSGLHNLALLSPDFVKLDMALVRGIESNPRMGSLIRHIVEFANDEGMGVVAEGVETKAEYDAVTELGAHYVQGYYLARPSPPFIELE